MDGQQATRDTDAQVTALAGPHTIAQAPGLDLLSRPLSRVTICHLRRHIVTTLPDKHRRLTGRSSRVSTAVYYLSVIAH